MLPRTVRVLERMLREPDLAPPRKIAPLVVWLCTDAAANINGRTFELWGNTISLLSEPEPLRTIVNSAGWDLDSLDEVASTALAADLIDRFALAEHPHLHTVPS